MLDGGRFEVRRWRTTDGFRYRVVADGERVLEGTLVPHRIGDFHLDAPDGEPVLRVTPDRSGVDDDLAPGNLGLAFAVRDARDGERDGGEVVGLVRRDLRSLYHRHWSLLDSLGLGTAMVVERSRLRSVARQRFTRLVPYRYAVRADGDEVGRFDGRVLRGYDLEVEPDAVDPRLALGASVVVDAVELTT